MDGSAFLGAGEVWLHKRVSCFTTHELALQTARGKSGLLAFSGFDNERRFELLLCRFGYHACPIALIFGAQPIHATALFLRRALVIRVRSSPPRAKRRRRQTIWAHSRRRGMKYLVLDNKRYLWRDILKLRREQRIGGKKRTTSSF